ncbi:MAG TPA: ACT domain-containing protein [Actinocrinis sp.]|nr:ACT domain-containing protein [Actinocrinis sp.]
MSKYSSADRGTRDGHRPSQRPGRRYEMIEMAVLFGTAAIADLLVDVLGHGSEGPGVLGCLSVVLFAVVVVHHAWNRHSTSPPRRRSAQGEDHVCAGDEEAGADADQDEPAEVGALWRIRTSVEDTPGRLAVLAGALAAAGANILTLQVHPTGTGATDEFLVRTPPGTAADTLTAAVRAAGGGEPWVGRAEVRALADPTAQALVLARRLVTEPGRFDPAAAGTGPGHAAASGEADAAGRPAAADRLPALLAELLGAEEARWHTGGPDAPHGPGSAPDGPRKADVTCASGFGEGPDCDTLLLAVPGRGTVRVTRAGLPFTPAEFARARAMAELAAVAAAPVPTDAADDACECRGR